VRAGRTPEELARGFEPWVQAIPNGVRQADRDDGRGDESLTSAEGEEIPRPPREVKQLLLEQEKAAAWFAHETDSIPQMPSGSST
jgi:transposase